MPTEHTATKSDEESRRHRALRRMAEMDHAQIDTIAQQATADPAQMRRVLAGILRFCRALVRQEIAED